MVEHAENLLVRADQWTLTDARSASDEAKARFDVYMDHATHLYEEFSGYARRLGELAVRSSELSNVAAQHAG